jgi:hypothetical protein
MGRLGSGGSGGRGRRRRCRVDAVESRGSGGGDGVTWGRRTAAGRGDEARCSGRSGEDDDVGVASVDGEGMPKLVKQILRIERSRKTKGGGSG